MDAKKFLDQIYSDADFRQKMMTAGSSQELVDAASAAGFTFTEDELRSTLDQYLEDHELTPEELDLFHGGLM